jgi:hypothetical protein
MKKAIILSTVVFMTITSACNSNKNKTKSEQIFSLDTTKLAKGDAFYQCPMHPEVISDKQGSCPKCGMELEKMEKK